MRNLSKLPAIVSSDNVKLHAQYEVFSKHLCPFTIMDERRIQVMKFMSLNISGNSNAQIRQTENLYTYKFKIYFTDAKDSFTMFKIEEREYGNFTDGGTMFEIENAGKVYVSKCPFKDYFNGTYIFCCINHGYCGNITVKIIFYKFGGFLQKVALPLEKTIWKKTMCSDRQQTQNIHYRHCTATELHKMQFNGYILKNKYLHWATGNCMVSEVKGRWKECIETKKTITFIGDSQMRYVVVNHDGEFTFFNKVDFSYNIVSDIHTFMHSMRYIF